MASNKKPLIVYQRRRDRISDLPDHILGHILSFLPTNYSVCTSALSRRWSLLYTLVPYLDFVDPGNNSDSFINFVWSVLKRYQTHLANIHKFSLKYHSILIFDIGKWLHSWISIAISRNVHQIFLNISSAVKFPIHMFSSETLVELKLRGPFIITLSDSIWLPSLKTFHLVNVIIEMGPLQHLCFSSCIVLEDLYLECGFCCDDSNVIDISVPSLKKLKLRPSYGGTICPIVIDAPALEFLSYHCFVRQIILGNGCESLARAEIGVRESRGIYDAGGFKNLMKIVSNVCNLFLFDHSMEALMGSEMASYQNLTRLELKSARSIGWNSLPDLLERVPNLEYLTLNNILLEEGAEIDHVLRAREYECLSMHLKEVELRKFSGFDYEFGVVKFFLENAKVLNKVIISFAKVLEGHEYISQKLLALPKYSRDCLVVVV